MMYTPNAITAITVTPKKTMSVRSGSIMHLS
jgi:hypothetical protein